MMKYTTEVIIELPREEVIKKLDNPDNMKHWQRGLRNYEFLNGSPGMEGTKMKLDFKTGNRKMVLTETIISRDLPKAFHANYDTKGVHNIQKNYFHEVGPHSTKWVSESEFRFSGLAMKMIGLLLPRLFKKQSQKYLNDFKNFAEKGISVAPDS